MNTLASPDWYAGVARFLGRGGWPESYLVVDIETNGVGIGALPLQIAWLGIQGGEPISGLSRSVVLDWTRGQHVISEVHLAESIEATRASLASKGKPYHLTVERVHREGLTPLAALAMLHSVVEYSASGGNPIVGYNHINFDLPIREHCDYCIDLGLIEKARANGFSAPPTGEPDYGPAEFYRFIADYRGRGGWSLDAARAAYGLPSDPARAHDAGADCWDTHLLMEAMRRLIES